MRRAALAVLLCWGCATAQVAGNAGVDLSAAVQEGVTPMDVNGVTILVKRVPHVKLVATQLYLKGGVLNWTAANAGVERLALATAVSGGTETLPKPLFARKLAALGSQLGAESTNDFAVVEAKSLTERWRPTVDLMADALLRPALPASEIELQRQLQLSALRQEDEDPDGQLEKLSHALVYHGLPYANRAVGTPASVAKLTRGDLEVHLAKLRQTSRWVMVVVGDIDPVEVGNWAKQAFAGLPHGDFQGAPLTPPVFTKPELEVSPRTLPTTYVMAAFPGPSWRDPDLAVGAVAMSALREKLFEEVRTKRELSYAPSAGLSLGGIGEGYLYVTAEDPNQTLKVMLDVVKEFQAGHIDPEVLEGDKRVFLTHFLLRDESTDGQASLLGRAYLLGGDWRIAGALLDRVRAVTPAQVAEFLSKSVRNLQTVVVGDAAKVDRQLFQSI